MAGTKKYTTVFRRPNTKKIAKAPKYPRSLKAQRVKLDEFSIIKFPLATETALKKIEDHNTLVFLCDQKATKAMIKKAATSRRTIGTPQLIFIGLSHFDLSMSHNKARIIKTGALAER